jgi:hypothetical protein
MWYTTGIYPHCMESQVTFKMPLYFLMQGPRLKCCVIHPLFCHLPSQTPDEGGPYYVPIRNRQLLSIGSCKSFHQDKFELPLG